MGPTCCFWVVKKPCFLSSSQVTDTPDGSRLREDLTLVPCEDAEMGSRPQGPGTGCLEISRFSGTQFPLSPFKHQPCLFIYFLFSFILFPFLSASPWYFPPPSLPLPSPPHSIPQWHAVFPSPLFFPSLLSLGSFSLLSSPFLLFLFLLPLLSSHGHFMSVFQTHSSSTSVQRWARDTARLWGAPCRVRGRRGSKQSWKSALEGRRYSCPWKERLILPQGLRKSFPEEVIIEGCLVVF